jgi:hypothetical protein
MGWAEENGDVWGGWVEEKVMLVWPKMTVMLNAE